MDFSEKSESEIKDLYIKLRQLVTDGEYDANSNQAYFELLEYASTEYGQEKIDRWNIEAATTAPAPVGNKKQKIPWLVIGTVAGILFWSRK